MGFTDAERETIQNIGRTGLHLNEGRPCECGGSEYTTRTKSAYSDSMVYTHTCGACGNEFSTWTEG